MRRLWILFALVMVLSFSVLGWIGTRIYQEAPLIPEKIVTPDGEVIIDTGEIQAGQNFWQSLGGMEVGSVWGHGSYVDRRLAAPGDHLRARPVGGPGIRQAVW